MRSKAKKQLCSLFSRYAFSETERHSINRTDRYWDEIAFRPDYHLSPHIKPRPNTKISHKLPVTPYVERYL